MVCYNVIVDLVVSLILEDQFVKDNGRSGKMWMGLYCYDVKILDNVNCINV